MISSEPEDLPEDQVLPGEDISPDWAQVNALQARKRADDAAKVADLEERNANQQATIESLKAQLDSVTEQKDRLVNQFWRRPFKDLTPEEQEAAGRLADAIQNPVNELGRWWMDLAAEEYGKIAAKMREYGGEGRAVDLIELGRDLWESGVKIPRYPEGGELSTPNDAEFAEAGCYFYLVGKFARWKAANREGRQVSSDTLHDIGVYVRMVQRIRQSGGWPT